MKPLVCSALVLVSVLAFGQNERLAASGDLNDGQWSLGKLGPNEAGSLGAGGGALTVSASSGFYGLNAVGAWTLGYGANVTSTALQGLRVTDGGFLSFNGANGGTTGGAYRSSGLVAVDHGTLSVDGMTVQGGTVRVGSEAGDVGTLQVGSAGTLKAVDSLRIVGGTLRVLSGTLDAQTANVQIDAGELKLDYFSQSSARSLTVGRPNSADNAIVNMNPLSSLNVGETMTIRSKGSFSTGSGGRVLVGDAPADVASNPLALRTLTVGPNGTLKGSGKITGDVDARGGTIAPGESPGTLNIEGAFRLDAASTLEIEVGSVSNFDRLLVAGPATLGGEVRVVGYGGFTPDLTAQNYDFLTATSVSILPSLRFVDAKGGAIAYFVRDGVLSFGAQPVPEPASMAVLALGTLAFVRRRRKA